MIDQKGKLFGIVNVVDLALLLIVLAFSFGFIWSKTGHNALNKVIKAEGNADVKIAIRGARIEDLEIFKKYKKAFIIIRNQPYAEVDIVDVKAERRPTRFYDDDTNEMVYKQFYDPYVTDIDIVIRDKAQFTGKDIVFGGNKVKAGIPIVLETLEYRFNGSVISVKMAGVTE